MRPLLTDFEDRMLALAEDEYVSFKVARPVFGSFYERNVSFKEIAQATGRLSALGLVKWRILVAGRYYFRRRASWELQASCMAFFTTTLAGKAHLARPRQVA